MRDQRINELKEWLYRPPGDGEVGVELWPRENDTEDISAAYALRTWAGRYVPVRTGTDATLRADVEFLVEPRDGDRGIIYVPRLVMVMRLRETQQDEDSERAIPMPFLASGWGEADLSVRITLDGASQLDVRRLSELLCLGIDASIDRDDLWEFEVNGMEDALQERMRTVASNVLDPERHQFGDRLSAHLDTMTAPATPLPGVYHVRTGMGLLMVEVPANPASPSCVCDPDHAGSYAERIDELAHEALMEGFGIDEKSKEDFWAFVASPPSEHIAEIQLTDAGHLCAAWHYAVGGQIDVEFQGGRQCVVRGIHGEEDPDKGVVLDFELAHDMVKRAKLRSAEEAYS